MRPTNVPTKPDTNYSKILIEKAHAESDIVLKELGTGLTGLKSKDAVNLLKKYGPNEIAREKHQGAAMRLFGSLKNPLIILLFVLAAISYFTGDLRATIVIMLMLVLGVVMRFVQEMRSDKAAEKLRAMVSNTATVIRESIEQELPLMMLVPGDIITLSAGNMVPADVRIISAKDLFLNQAALTGEALPVEKTAKTVITEIENTLELSNICYMGSNVESGSATAVVINTGKRTYFGSLADSIMGQRQLTSFDKGINKFTWLMIRFIAIMVPLVFVINGLSKNNWMEAFLFAMAVAVGLTPELLPMIVTVNLSKGAIAMSRKKVIVKRLNSIQNLGAMDVLCTDKTGTLTQGKIVLEKHLDVHGNPSEKVLEYGFLNSFHHTGLKNLLDSAILEHADLAESLRVKEKYKKIDEIPFDFIRRRMSVIVEDETGMNTLICKGAVEEILNVCTRTELDGKIYPVTQENDARRREISEELNRQGFRVIALAYKQMPGATDEPVYAVADESELVLIGFLAFLDPPKDTAKEALQLLHALNIDVKILTGDNELVTAYVCREVGVPVDKLLLGSQIEAMSDDELAEAASSSSVFARLVPSHKDRIIHALQSKGHVTGFLGDGINDAPALKAADVGISVNSAVDIAKESSDIILLENSLLVLEQGVLEGRRVFGNIIKYVKMAASSNFGNMFSVVGASAFLPFLPLLPIQVLTNNLLYDFSQTTIPTDSVDSEWLTIPRKWTIDRIKRFILFIGPISSIFDYLTFFMMLYIFNAKDNPALFRTGWFVESVFTQTLIIHVIRTSKIPFLQSRASTPLIISSLLIVTIAALLTISPLAKTLGFVTLPALYWPLLAIILISYVLLTQIVKTWFIRRYGD